MTVDHVDNVAIAAEDHIVHFYERDPVLILAVARYLRDGLETGAAAIMIATAEHESQVLEQWKSDGFDFAPARERGQLILLDAEPTLARLTVDGWPQPDRFEQTIGFTVEAAIGRFGRVLAFGEMVALLWAQGRLGAAVRLEGLWNALAARHKFALYCAYPLRDCGKEGSSDAFHDVCLAHSRVIPAETAAGLEDDPQRLIALLRQKTAALEREIEVRKRVEGQLAERERELSDFLDHGVYGLHKVGPDGTILWANQAELEMLGYEASEYIGRNIANFHVGKAGIERILERLGEGETLRDQPATLRCKDGTVRHVLISSNALREEGRLVSTRCFTRDVSDRWLAQEALRERGAMLHLAMQGARMGYWIGDLERQSLRCSQELAALLGLSSAFDWTLDAFVALIHPEDRKSFREAMQESLETHHQLLCEFRVRRDVADWRWFEGRGEAVYDEDGRAIRFYGMCMDVTARKREQQMLAHLAAVVDSAEDAIVSKTLDGIVMSWNAGAARLFGYEAGEMIGRPITTIIPAELHYEEARILARVRAGDRIDHYRTVRVAKDGTRKSVSLAVSPVRDASGKVVGASKIARLVVDA